MSSFWDDLKSTASDAWNGKPDLLGDVAATGTDLVNTFVPILPEGQEVKKDVDGFTGGLPSIANDTTDSWGLARSNPGGANEGNHIGTVLGGLVGGLGGPLGAAVGMDEGSEIGGNIDDFISSL